MEKEIWKKVKGYEGCYEVSNMGNIKSLYSNKILKPNKIKRNKNYTAVTINLSRFGISTSHLVSRIVATAFIPNPKYKPQVNHIDFNPQNNNVTNLEWCTARENYLHSKNAGRMRVTTLFETNPEKIEVVKYLLKKDFTYHDIARLFDCETLSIKNIHKNYIHNG